MADQSAVPIKGRVARFIQVDVCGNPITGASGLQVITKGFISVQIEPQYEDGEKLRQKLADGSLCGVCPSIAQIVTGARLLGTGAPVTGTGAAYSEGVVSARWALEVWQNVTGRGACDPITGAPKYVYWAFPNLGHTRQGSSTIQ